MIHTTLTCFLNNTGCVVMETQRFIYMQSLNCFWHELLYYSDISAVTVTSLIILIKNEYLLKYNVLLFVSLHWLLNSDWSKVFK